MRSLIGPIMRLALLLGLIAPFTCVVVAAWLGNGKPLAVWILLCAVSAVGFLLGIRRAASRDNEHDASRTVLPVRQKSPTAGVVAPTAFVSFSSPTGG